MSWPQPASTAYTAEGKDSLVAFTAASEGVPEDGKSGDGRHWQAAPKPCRVREPTLCWKLAVGLGCFASLLT